MKYKIKDRIVLGALAGVTGSIVKEIFEELLIKKGWNTSDSVQMAYQVFGGEKFTNEPLCKLVGNLANLGIGGGLGVPIMFLLSLTGKDYAILKGATLGHLAWVYFYGGINRVRMSKKFPLPLKSDLTACFAHIIYGMTTAAVIKALGHDDLFTPAKIMDKPARQKTKDRIVFRYRQGKYYLQN